MGLRDKHKVIVGGGVTTQAYADSIGADGFAANAVEAARLCKSLVSK
jgi:methanogenic corrinoid protein MtbC1